MSSDIGLPNKLFNLNEAQGLIALIRSVTTKHQGQLTPIQQRLNKMLANDPRRKVLEQQYEVIVSRWRHKMTQLGATVAGLWVVEFDVGEGVLSWRYPELSLAYFRQHHAGHDCIGKLVLGSPRQALAERVKLSQYIEEHDPDWAR